LQRRPAEGGTFSAFCVAALCGGAGASYRPRCGERRTDYLNRAGSAQTHGSMAQSGQGIRLLCKGLKQPPE